MPRFDVNIRVEAEQFFCYTGDDGIMAPDEATARRRALEYAREAVKQGDVEIERIEVTAIEEQETVQTDSEDEGM